MNRRAAREPEYRPQYKHPPKVIAKLDLYTPVQRRLHDTIRYFHSDMWPVFKTLDIRQLKDGTICEAVQWGRTREERFSLVRWRPDGRGFSWIDYRSADTAMRALRSARPSPSG